MKGSKALLRQNFIIELSNSENFTITIIEVVIFTFMNTITIVDLLNILIHNTYQKLSMEFLSTMKYHCFGCILENFW